MQEARGGTRKPDRKGDGGLTQPVAKMERRE